MTPYGDGFEGALLGVAYADRRRALTFCHVARWAFIRSFDEIAMMRVSKQPLATMTEFHHARVVAIDNWTKVQAAMSSPADRVAAIGRALEVSDLGALSVLAIAGGPPPDRSQLEAQLSSLEFLHRLIANRL